MASRLFYLSLIILLSSCGVGGVTTIDCDNPTPSQVAECEIQNETGSSDWNKMKWTDDKWG